MHEIRLDINIDSISPLHLKLMSKISIYDFIALGLGSIFTAILQYHNNR